MFSLLPSADKKGYFQQSKSSSAKKQYSAGGCCVCDRLLMKCYSDSLSPGKRFFFTPLELYSQSRVKPPNPSSIKPPATFLPHKQLSLHGGRNLDQYIQFFFPYLRNTLLFLISYLVSLLQSLIIPPAPNLFSFLPTLYSIVSYFLLSTLFHSSHLLCFYPLLDFHSPKLSHFLHSFHFALLFSSPTFSLLVSFLVRI